MKNLFLLLIGLFFLFNLTYAQNKAVIVDTQRVNKCYSIPLFIDYEKKTQKGTTENNDEYITFDLNRYSNGGQHILSPTYLVLSHLNDNYRFKLYFSHKYAQFVLMFGNSYYFLGNTRPILFQENMYLRLMPLKEISKSNAFAVTPNNMEKAAFLYLYDCNLQQDTYSQELEKQMKSQCSYYRLKTNYQATQDDYKGFSLTKTNTTNQGDPNNHLDQDYDIDLYWSNDSYHFMITLNGKKSVLFQDLPIFFQENMFLLLRRDTGIYTDDSIPNPNNLEKSYFVFLGDCTQTLNATPMPIQNKEVGENDDEILDREKYPE